MSILPPISRHLNWVSSLDPAHGRQIDALEARMVRFYAESDTYYGDINFTAGAWGRDPIYRDIALRLEATRDEILEVGCGVANVLAAHRNLGRRYIGCDFSPTLIGNNRLRYPEARFDVLVNAQRLPFESDSFEAVFSVFVLEHTLRPASFLDECVRVLRPGGRLIILCPRYLDSGKMASQRAGLSHGTGRQKLARGRIWDALLTAYDRKLAIPARCRRIRRQIGCRWGFWINLSPVCFTDPFAADHDAVYLTYEAEVRSYLDGRIVFEGDSHPVSECEVVYLAGTKR